MSVQPNAYISPHPLPTACHIREVHWYIGGGRLRVCERAHFPYLYLLDCWHFYGWKPPTWRAHCQLEANKLGVAYRSHTLASGTEKVQNPEGGARQNLFAKMF